MVFAKGPSAWATAPSPRRRRHGPRRLGQLRPADPGPLLARSRFPGGQTRALVGAGCQRRRLS
eukprot:3403531-Alexandrium_andersonii.AAC.1